MKPKECAGCPLEKIGTGWVPSYGCGKNGVLVMAEAPGEVEARRGLPLQGRAGKRFDEVLKIAGVNREDFALSNVLSCRPPNNELSNASYEWAAIHHCDIHRTRTIAAVKPKVILAMGNVALRTLTGMEGIMRYRGFVLDGPGGIPVIGTLHPSFLLPGRAKGQRSTSHFIPAVVRDIQLAVEVAKRGVSRLPINYLEDPLPLRFNQFVEEYEAALRSDPSTWLAYDIETPYRQKVKDEENLEEVDTVIVRISFAFRPGYAVSVPFQAPYLPGIRRLLASSGRKASWNGFHFDEPALDANGCPLGGRHFDMMWGWHCIQPDLVGMRGLEKATSFFAPDMAPWKHESTSRPAFYSACDSDATVRNAIGIERSLKASGQWELFEHEVCRLWPHLRKAGENGIVIDRKARRILYKRLRKEQNILLRQVQPLIPSAILPRKRYKKWPVRWEGKRPIEEVSVADAVPTCSKCGAQNVTKGGHAGRKVLEKVLKAERHHKKCSQNGHNPTQCGCPKGWPKKEWEVKENACYKAEIVARPGMRSEFDVVLPFNPLSVDQLAKYVEHFGHPMGRNYKTGQPSLDDMQLEILEGKFGAQHPLYGLVRELRELGKTISTYVVGLKPNARGVVETSYSFQPASGRLASKGVQKGSDKGTNLQNIPHRGDHPYADDIRRMIIPIPGHVFVQADSSSIEAVMSGYFMDDPDYMEIARKGVHAYTACKALGLEFTPENIKKVKAAHKTLYERKKKTNHSVNYGASARLLFMGNRRFFRSIADAQAEIDTLYKLLPRLGNWHHAVRVQANEDHYLVNPFGWRRWFFDVFQYVRDKEGNCILDEKTKKPKIQMGEDGKAVIAQLPQSSAAIFMRQNARMIAEHPRVVEGTFKLPGNFLVHDSYCLMVPDEPGLIEEAVQVLRGVLTRPIPEMSGLEIGCDVEVGMDWGPGLKKVG